MSTILRHIVTHGLLFALISTGTLFLIMITTGPRVWGYNDYSDTIKSKVPPQTKRERRLSIIVGIPWMVIVFLLPIASTLALKHKLGGDIPFHAALLNMLVLTALGTLGDVFILDYLIVSKITPGFVIIPGTEAGDYKDMSHHFKGHLKAIPYLIAVCLLAAAAIWYF